MNIVARQRGKLTPQTELGYKATIRRRGADDALNELVLVVRPPILAETLQGIPGVARAESREGGRLHVFFDAGATGPRRVLASVQALTKASVRVADAKAPTAAHDSDLISFRRSFLGSLCFTVPIVVGRLRGGNAERAGALTLAHGGARSVDGAADVQLHGRAASVGAPGVGDPGARLVPAHDAGAIWVRHALLPERLQRAAPRERQHGTALAGSAG
jgi:hypothetical protein